jgi:hypothetical protein
MKVNQKKSVRQEEQQSLAGEGVGGPNSDDWTENLALSLMFTLWYTRIWNSET